MKEAVFDPAWYADEHYLALEKREIFEKLWLVAGFRSALKKDGDYFTIAIFDYEIVVHLLNGQPRAYFNICPHRGGAIVTDVTGNTRPVCKYHGWAFRDGAALTGVRMANAFEHDAVRVDDACGRGLTTLAVAVVGPLIFINMDGQPLAIEEQFPADVLEQLERAGQGSAVLQADFLARYNWKLNMENVKDWMHAPFVHSSTFLGTLPEMQRQLQEHGMIRMRETEARSFGRFVQEIRDLRLLSYRMQSCYEVEEQWYDSKIKRRLSPDHYENIFLFPNTNFCSVGGRYYATQQYFPKSAGSFFYRMNFCLAEMTAKFDAAPLLMAIARGERFVIDEDSVVLERVQRGFASASGREWRFTQGDYEEHLMRQMVYLRDCVYREV
ncbi:aromatic ring-hydroxylating oxygenase subunit alpha [Bordetella avium]|uniref:Dioxygenase n=1 Tax=Bordetella avium (strain 197N) TaxID=360910 RepID=Q2KUH0_BORA1|nr:SRPBCC family protein [Bordetella avium]RIQ55542.1 ring-hydroxylating oxygenase subunit alpha [Bordetella avium]RIQ73876.1 ring-hydroxylating oxygenase subunit alpha [Bordetella avium]CAJ50690.1 Putative dioxygenase [Bordetella avium 197N]